MDRGDLNPVVGNLFTTAGQKRVGNFVAGGIHNSMKDTHNMHPYISSGVLRAAKELLAGSMWQADCKLPTPALTYNMVVNNITLWMSISKLQGW